MDKSEVLTQERLKELIEYNPETGELVALTTITSRSGNTPCGWITGRESFESKKLMINNITYELTVLIWLYMSGEYPQKLIDHIDGNRLNNKWVNLRLATYSQNSCNRKLSSNNSIGIKGICVIYRRGIPRYRARVRLNQRTNKALESMKDFVWNLYPTKELALESAINWLKDTRKSLHGEYTNHG